MSHWTNSQTQFIGVGSGQATAINFDTDIIGGNQTIVTQGIYTYSYHLNMAKPSGEVGPTRIGAALFVSPPGPSPIDMKIHTTSYVEIDTWAREVLQHTGEIYLNVGDTIGVVVWTEHDFPTVFIRTLPWRCTMTIRRVLGLGS